VGLDADGKFNKELSAGLQWRWCSQARAEITYEALARAS
jgi:hypothetical protein